MAITPYLETLPYEGFNPITPHHAEGFLIDPPVSDPIVAGTRYEETAAAEPPDEPPGTRFKSHGFLVGL